MPHTPANLKVNDLVIWHVKNNGVNQPMSGWVVDVLAVGAEPTVDFDKYDLSHAGPGHDVIRQGEVRVLVKIPQLSGKPLLVMPDPRLLRISGTPDRANLTAGTLSRGKNLRIVTSGDNAEVSVAGEHLQHIESLDVKIKAGEATQVIMTAYTPELELNGYIVSVEPFDPLAEEESE